MEDLTGKKFSRLTVLGFAGRRGNNYYWECQCDCGSFRHGQEQSRNLRRNTKLTLNGRTQLLCEWSEETGIKASTLCYRLYKLGWSVEKTLTTPVRGTKVKCND